MSELDGMAALTEGVHRQAFPHTTDAAIWAKEFRQTQIKLGQEPLDEGWMLTWFANAIMAGFDTAQSRQASAMAKAHADGRREAYEEVARDFHVEPSEVLPACGEYVRGLAAQLEVVYLRKAEAVRAQAQKEGA